MDSKSAAPEPVREQRPLRKTNFLYTLTLCLGAILSLLAVFELSSLAPIGSWARLVEPRNHGFPEKRATTGTQYLLGVGKADITGFVPYLLSSFLQI